ncbi:MAG: helix-turn-helix domain-containing protein [Bacteroidaceae bacterium]|nr:helix-turn-helix domain-containing protein [Bacteroidaceae bacterium]
MENELKSMIADLLAPIIDKSVKQAVADVLGVQNDANRYPVNVNVEQAAEITGYKVNSLYQMHSRNQVPGAYRIGGKLMFRTADLMAWASNK